MPAPHGSTTWQRCQRHHDPDITIQTSRSRPTERRFARRRCGFLRRHLCGTRAVRRKTPHPQLRERSEQRRTDCKNQHKSGRAWVARATGQSREIKLTHGKENKSVSKNPSTTPESSLWISAQQFSLYVQPREHVKSQQFRSRHVSLCCLWLHTNP